MGLPANVEEVRETLRKIQKNLECPICLELLSDPYTTQCSHPFCRMCIYTVISSTREAKCPLCKEPISKRSMNENIRLAEIVEAVKELEQAIVKDSGVPRTPPRPLPPHSHEATGTPGVIVHSLLHPTPQKPHNTLSEDSVAVHGSQNSRNETRPLVAATCTSNRQAHHSCSPKGNVSTIKHHKSVRFATTKPTSRKRKIPRVTSSASSQAALLQALEEVDFAEPGATLNSAALELKSKPVEPLKPQSMLGIHGRGNASEEEKQQQTGAKVATVIVEEAALSSPVRKRARREESQRLRETLGSSQNIFRVLETPAVVDAIKVNCLEPSTCTGTSNSPCDQNRGSKVSEDASTSQPKRVAETPWLVPRGSASGEGVTEKLIETGCQGSTSQLQTAHGQHCRANSDNQDSKASEDTPTSQLKRIAETPWLVPGGNVSIAEEGAKHESQNDASQHEMEHDQQGTAPVPRSPLNPSQHRQERGDSDITVLGEETPSIEPSTNIPRHSAADSASCAVRETQITSAHSQATSQGIIVAGQGRISPAPAARADKHRVCCISETQLENQGHIISGGNFPSSYNTSTQQDSVSSGNRSCVSEGDTTPSLSPASLAANDPSTSHTTPIPSLDHGPADVEDLNSTLHTGNKVQPEELQNGTQTSALIQASTPLHSSPKCAEVPIVPPLFTSPPLTPSSPSSVLNHSISPSLPMQNTYMSSAVSSRGSLTQEQTVVPDTYGAVRPEGASRVDETQFESIPSTQQSPVAPSFRSHTLLGLYKTLNGQLPQSTQSYNLQTSPSQPSHGTQNYHKSTLVATQQAQSVPAISPRPTHSQRNPDGNSYSPPGSVTVIPDSLLPHTQCHLTSSTHNDSPPRETANLTDEPSTSGASEGSSSGTLSPDRDTQWDGRSSAFTQELTSQELEALRREMEKKEQEILELEALLQQDTKGPSAGKQPELSSSSSRITDSLDVINTSPTVTSNHDHQPETSQTPAVKNGANSCSSFADTHSQVSVKTGPPSPEITVIADTVPDSFPPVFFQGSSHENPCTLHLQQSSKKTKLECDVSPNQVSRAGGCISSLPATQISMSTGSHSSSRMKPLVQNKIDTLLQQPLTQTKTSHSPYTHQYSKTATPLSGQIRRKKNQHYSKTSPTDSSWLKKPSPTASNNEAKVLETASKLIKALRSPPQVILESETTLEVDRGLYETPTPARASTTPQAKHSAKRTKNAKGHSASLKQKAPSQGKPAKKKRPLVVLDSQDLESYSPPPINDPLPFDHPFMSISTSPHKQSLLHNQQTVHHHTMEEKSKCITAPPASILETPHVKLSDSMCPGESPTCVDHPTVPPSFLASGLTKAQLSQAQILVKKHGGCIASCFNGNTTHIIVQADENGCCPRTVKYLQGVAAGKWIMEYNWVKDSLEAGLLLPEVGYEVRGDQVYSVNAPSKARKCRSNGEPGLFHQWSFYLAGQFQGISQDHLAQLIQLAEGTIMQTFPTEMDHGLLIYDGDDTSAWLHCKDVTVIASSWVLDSFSHYCLLPAEKYQH